MKQVISDFYKHHIRQLIGYGAVTVFAVIGLWLSGMFTDEKLWWAGIGVAVFLVAMTLWFAAEVFFVTPVRFKKQLAAMPERELNRLLKEYPAAKLVDSHRYMESFLLFYSYRKLYVMRYTDITKIEGGSKHLFLTVKGYGKAVILPFDSTGQNAVAMVYLRDKNPKIKVPCDRNDRDAD